MAFAQVGVPFYEELNRTAFVKPNALPESPPSSPGNSFSLDEITSDCSFNADSCSSQVPAIRASCSRPSEAKSYHSSSRRRLSGQFQPMLTSGFVESERVSTFSRFQGTGFSSQQTQNKDGSAQITQKGRKRSSLVRDEVGKMEAVSTVVSPDAGSQATAALPDASLMGADSAYLNSTSSNLTIAIEGAWKCDAWSREEEEAKLIHELRLKRDRVCDSYRKRVERMAADFSKIRNELRALHLEERCDLNRKWEEDSLETLHGFLDSEKFESLSDEDYDRTLRQLADQNERKRQSDLEQLERRHMADWRRFLSDKKVSLVQLQEALEMKLELLDTGETSRITDLQTESDSGFQSS